mmetsp:Transcript_24546/g.33642  ORF Transcript_24546/g.33642 Transcript_24546/m.33642 type:complete len:559 (+) Transcript_24546:11-1687(+)
MTVEVCIFHVIAILASITIASSTWTNFDLVRPRAGAWGSHGQTSFIKYNSKRSGFNISEGAKFGTSVANIGDLDKDGVDDIAVGAVGENIYRYNRSTIISTGGLYIIFLKKDGSTKSVTHIGSQENGGPLLIAGDQFGYSVDAAGDLDGDSVLDIIVGAPGYSTSSVYILFMNTNGSVKKSKLIRGRIIGAILGANVMNGPPIHFGSRFGTAVANIGDLNKDGIQDFAVSALDISSGFCQVFVLFLNRNGTVQNYSTIDSYGRGGGPNIAQDFPGFGSSLVALADMNNDNINDLAIGAKDITEPGSRNTNAGAVYICFMKKDGTIKSFSRISELSGKPKYILPWVPYDECGQALANIGDINLDPMKQRHPTQLRRPYRAAVDDLVVGCPQGGQGTLPGRLFFIYLTSLGFLNGYTVLPAATDGSVGPALRQLDLFGSALGAYSDVDGNGLKEILVGAPGDDESGLDSGAVYLLFPRRRRYHPPTFDEVRFVLLIFFPSLCCCGLMAGATAFCLHRYRRLPDPIEKIVIEAGLEISPVRSRKVYVQSAPPDDRCHEYTD